MIRRYPAIAAGVSGFVGGVLAILAVQPFA
jgi:hypothetical protein